MSSPYFLTPSQFAIIENVKQWMTRNAYEPSTIKYTSKRLMQLLRYTKYDDPEQIKEYIAKKQVSNAYKESLIETYAIYMRMLGRRWEQPFYDRYDKPPTIPKE